MAEGGKSYPFDEKMIEHADRAWNAECDNAERITKERHLVLTLLVAVLGVGVFKVDWIDSIIQKAETGTVCFAITSLLVLSATFFVIALFALAHRHSKISASSSLSLPKSAYYPEGEMSTEDQKRTIFARTYRAYQILQSRNERARDDLTRAWTRFGIGMLLVGAAVVVYIIQRFMSMN